MLGGSCLPLCEGGRTSGVCALLRHWLYCLLACPRRYTPSVVAEEAQGPGKRLQQALRFGSSWRS